MGDTGPVVSAEIQSLRDALAVSDDPDLLLYGTSGYPGTPEKCEVCGQEVYRLNLRQRDGSVTHDYFEVVKHADTIRDAQFILHSDRHTGRRSVDTR